MAYQSIQQDSNSNAKNEDNCQFLHYDNDELSGPPLPATIYSSAMVCSLGFTKEDLNSLNSWLILLPNWFFVFFNTVFSLIVIKCIIELRDETPECEADFLLLMLCVIAFSTYNMGEIFETFAMFHWIYHQPTVASHEVLTFSSNEDDKEIVSGMTASYKLWCYVCLVLPKLVIGLLITWYGNTFLLVSDSNQDVILNSMALGFITQNDEIIFEAMVPQSLKEVTSALPPVRISYQAKIFGLFKPYVMVLLVVLYTYFTYASVCLDDPVR